MGHNEASRLVVISFAASTVLKCRNLKALTARNVETDRCYVQRNVRGGVDHSCAEPLAYDLCRLL